MSKQHEHDYLVKTVVITLASFLLVEALLPKKLRNFAFLYLVLLETMLWVIAIVEKGMGGVHSSVRLLSTYIVLSALLIE